MLKGSKHTIESKNKNSESKKRYFSNGGLPGFKDKKHSEKSNLKNHLAHLGKKHSEEHNKKISIGVISAYNDPLLREKLSLIKKNDPTTRYWLNKNRSEETKQKISINNPRYWLGRKQSEEMKEKNRLGHLGKSHPQSEKTRKKISLGLMGNTNGPKIFPFINTSIEIKVQNLLKEAGIQFETQYKILGQPDIFIAPNICIFADGCYWHGCKACGYDKDVIKKSVRDNYVTTELQKQGYTVIRIWEHEINQSNFNKINQIIP